MNRIYSFDGERERERGESDTSDMVYGWFITWGMVYTAKFLNKCAASSCIMDGGRSKEGKVGLKKGEILLLLVCPVNNTNT